jgi:CDP-glycerol glycerophosphotransferase (TagB/SpsB family)
MPNIVYFAEKPGAHYEALYLMPFLDITGGTFITNDKEVIKRLKAKYSNVPKVRIKYGTKHDLVTIDTPVSVYSNFYPRSQSKYNVFFYHGIIDKKGVARVHTFKDQRSRLYKASNLFSMNSIINPLSNNAVRPFRWFRGLIKDRFDLLLLPGQVLYDLFRSIGVIKKGNNRIIGFPRHDQILRGEIDKIKVLKDLGLNPSRKTVLYAPTWHGKLEFNMNSMETMGLAVVNAVMDDINLIVRPHPRSITMNEAPNVMEILRERSATSDNIRLVDDPFFDTVKLLAAADMGVTDYSTIGVEFFAFDKPVIFLDHLGDLYSDQKLMEIYTRDAGYIVSDPKYIRKMILLALKNPGEKKNIRKKYTSYFFGPRDGRAGERGAEAIKNLLASV